ncbi:hypothetical protein Acsp04_58830 [Actinomadura sp. NBRC 104425]|nr:hypothetical protein [Actinomadura sp. NBRC 104425]GLZ15648.1 hypothetical protein Acsp04_58830 [Actinomadura sp. NBRC 104425]
MTTAEMLRDAGALAVLAVLGLALAVLLLRLVALPLAAGACGPAGQGVSR